MFGRIEHESYARIIRFAKCLPPSLRRNMNQFNSLNGEDPNEQPKDCSIQPQAPHCKPNTSTPNTIPVVSAITRIFNHHAIDNRDVKVHTSDFPV